MKKCKVCGEEKDEFDFDAGVTNGIQYTRNTCKKCRYAKQKKGQKDRHLRNNYDIDTAEWEMILESQGGKCKLCDKVFDDSKICTDHNHKTEVVRGLLCSNCNLALRFFDDPVLHDKFMDYSKNANALKELREHLANT